MVTDVLRSFHRSFAQCRGLAASALISMVVLSPADAAPKQAAPAVKKEKVPAAKDGAPVVYTDLNTYVSSVQTKGYQATVDYDGSLTSLKIGGQEFLLSRPRGEIPRGVYLFQAGPVGLPATTRPSPNTVLAKGDTGSLAYEFQPLSVKIVATNTSAAKMFFFIAIAPGVTNVLDATGRAYKTPANVVDQPVSTWFLGKQKLKIDGQDKRVSYYPWGDKQLQIWQFELDANESRAILLETGTATKAEMTAISKVPPPR